MIAPPFSLFNFLSSYLRVFAISHNKSVCRCGRRFNRIKSSVFLSETDVISRRNHAALQVRLTCRTLMGEFIQPQVDF